MYLQPVNQHNQHINSSPLLLIFLIMLYSPVLGGTNPYSSISDAKNTDKVIKQLMQAHHITRITNYMTRQGFITYADSSITPLKCRLPLQATITLNHAYHYQTSHHSQHQAEQQKGLKGYLLTCIKASL